MIDGSDRVTFDGVEVISATDLVVMCDVGARVVGVPPPQMLPGKTGTSRLQGRLTRGWS
jgi:hypothetical protein